jgi:hypothetical protein
MTQLLFTQTEKPTKEQQSKIDAIFTADYVIETSKIVSNEAIQHDLIKLLESKIDSLKIIAKKKDEIITKYGNEIILLNNQIRQTNLEENEVADNQLKQAKKPFLGLHLKTRLTFQEFDVSKMNFSGNLSYDLKKFSVGLSGWTQSIQDINNPTSYNSEMFYGAFVQYNIF